MESGPSGSTERAGLVALVGGLFLVCLVEVLVPTLRGAFPASAAPGIFAHVVDFAYTSLREPLTYGGAVVIAELVFRLRPPKKRWPRVAVHAALAAALVAHAYLTLLRYEEFKDHPILVVPYVVALGFFTALGSSLGWPRVRRLAAHVGLAAFAVLHGLNHAILPDSYFTFHLSLLELTFAALFLGLLHTLVRRTRIGRAWLIGAAATAAGLAAMPFAAKSLEKTLPPALLHTLLGRLQVVYSPFTEGSEGPPAPKQIDPEGVARFKSLSGLPTIPPDIQLADFNVLLVESEAFRFDRTSLAREDLKTTPNLVELERAGAFVFTNAHSPSSATLPSNAGLMSMTYPSATRLDAWSRSWCGELSQEENTVAEILKRAGYSTFRASHDFHFGFTDNLLGFEQGFDEQVLVPEATKEDGMTLDRRIAEHAAAYIRERRDKRFFGWVFFASPHEPYYTRYDDWPKATNEQKYLQELRYVDEQLGLLVQTLKDEGLFEKTIVIFLADHGEELGDHGGKGHKTLHDECTHVPLVVRIPGLAGSRQSAPTSTLYTFPWLFLRGEPETVAAAEKRLVEDIGPMLKATHGAVVSELVAYDKMSTALIYGDGKIIYNFIANAAVAFDLTRDPGEKVDLVATAPASPKVEELQAAVAAYREVRRGMRRYTLNPKKRPSHAKWKEAKQ